MAAERKRYVVRYTGNVQGVGFRFTVVAQSDQLEVHGFVRNESDGSVLMDVEGPAEDLDRLVDRIDSAMRRYIRHAQIDQHPARGIEGGLRVAY